MAFRLKSLPPSDEWSVSDVGDWLEIVGLERHKETFAAEEISGSALTKLTQGELRADLQLPLGDCKLLAAELEAQRRHNKHKRLPRRPLMHRKGQLGVGEKLSPRTRERVRRYSGDGCLRAKPLEPEELECWDHQVSWLRCAITGAAWPKDSKALIGTALYHQPRFISQQEFRRRQLDEDHAVRRKKREAPASGPEASAAQPAEKAAETKPEVVGADLSDEWDVLPAVGAATGKKDDEEQKEELPQEADLRTGRNNKGEVGVGDEYDRDFEVYPHVEPPPENNLQSISEGAKEQLGWIEVMVGPVFEREAFNTGANSLEKRGITCLDRQYNAVNFQFYVQRHANSFARKVCTSRLSFYIEEGHGQRVFPENILSQLSLLFYRANDRLNKNGVVNQERVATCIMRAIPKILLQTVLEVLQGAGFEQYCEHAIRLYLIIHHTAIKLISFFPKAHQCVYDAVKEWIQNPFAPVVIWGPEEVMLAASLVSVPFSLLREPLVRRVLHDMQGAAGTSTKVLLKQNREVLERLTFVQAFFEGGPGRLGVIELEAKYTRCAGTLPKAERDQLLVAVREAQIDSCEDWWRSTGMDGIFVDDEQCAANMLTLREHVLANAASWGKKKVQSKRSDPQQRAVGAEELGSTQSSGRYVSAAEKKRQNALKRKAELDAARVLHQGYPKLDPTQRDGGLSSTTCMYCKASFKSRGALFHHLNEMIEKKRMVNGWHQAHFCARVTPKTWSAGPPFKCPARCCQNTSFWTEEELRAHMVEMGVPGVSAAEKAEPAGEPTPSDDGAAPPLKEAVAEEECVETGVVDPMARPGQCFRCPKPRDTLLAQCGHTIACEKCAKALKTCPVCSKPVTLCIKVCWS